MQDVTNAGKKERPDPLSLAIDTPDDKLSQFTVIPTGAVNAFAMSATIQKMGKKDFWKNMTPMEYYTTNIFKFNRSRGGKMLGTLMQIAQTQVEVDANNQAEQGSKFLV